MKNFSTWLLVSFMILFWISRIVITLAAEFAIDLGGIEPLNKQMEIILLFVVLVCTILIIKRNLIGALVYLIAHGIYFGTNLITGLTAIFAVEQYSSFNISMYTNTFIALIGIAIPIAVLFDILMERYRKANPRNKQTDWYYKNDDYDRKLDERADKNNYRTM